MKNKDLLAFLALCSLAVPHPVHAEKSLHAHVHGAIKMDIATDGKSMKIELNGPAESFVGFEYIAKTESEKKIWEEMKQKWQTPLERLIVLAPELKCTAGPASVEQEGEKHESNHSDLNISVDIKCEQDLAGKNLEIAIIENFPKIKKLEINLLRSSENPELRKSAKKREIFKL